MTKFILSISLSMTCIICVAQDTEALEIAFSSASADLLVEEFEKEIEICIGKEIEFLTADKGVIALNQWFSKVKPYHMSGKIVGGSMVKYYNGQVKTEFGNYRVLVYFNSTSDGYKIDEIRIGTKS